MVQPELTTSEPNVSPHNKLQTVLRRSRPGEDGEQSPGEVLLSLLHVEGHHAPLLHAEPRRAKLQVGTI